MTKQAANHVGMFNPAHVNRACSRDDLLCPDTRALYGLNWKRVDRSPTCVARTCLELCAVASCSVNKCIFPKTRRLLWGIAGVCRDANCITNTTRVPFKSLFIRNARAHTQNQGLGWGETITAIIKRTKCQAGRWTKSDVQKMKNPCGF